MNTTIDKNKYKQDVFISYSKYDRDFVKSLMRTLKSYGYRVWRGKQVLSFHQYAAGIFIGGMEGVEEGSIFSQSSVRMLFLFL